MPDLDPIDLLTSETDVQFTDAEIKHAGLEPLLDLDGALKVLADAGYKEASTHGYFKTFYHPDYDGMIYCEDEKAVLDIAESLVEALRATRRDMNEAGCPDLTDDEIRYIAEHW